MESSALAGASGDLAPMGIDGAVGGVLPSGRSLVLRTNQQGEEIEVRAPDGNIEIRIALTDKGPVLSLRGVRLEIDASSAIDVKCTDLSITAENTMRLQAEQIGVRTSGEIRMKSGDQTFIDGDWVNLNCLSREGYHDYVPAEKTLAAQPESPGLPERDDC